MSSRAFAILLMSLSALVIPIVDTIAKTLTATASPFFLVWARYAIGAVLVLLVFARPPRALAAFRRAPGLHLGRSALLVAAMACFYGAIAGLPVATALGGFFTGPVIAALLSAAVLGERLSLPRLLAVVVGLVGALLILRPEGVISGHSLFALLSGVLSGVYLVLTRRASIDAHPADNVLIQSVAGALIMLPPAILNWPTLDGGALGLLALMGVLSVVAHGLFLTAFKTLEVNTLAPLAYLELVTATALGWVIFSELPIAQTWLGIALVVAGGLVVTLTPSDPERFAASKR